MSETKRKVPKLRFPGFTEDWEQRKLGEVVERVSCTSEDSEIPQVEYEDIISGEGRLNKDITKKLSNKKGILFRKGDVLYGKLRPYLKNWLLPDFSGKAVGDFWVLRSEKVQSSFLYNLIQSNRFELASNQSTGTKMPRADWNLVANTEFPIPVSIEEQISIGNIFKLLNNSITLHQRKLGNLKLKKKALLQKLFPKNGEQLPELRFPGFTDAWEQRKLGELFDRYESRVETPHDGYWRLGLRSHCKGTFHTYVEPGSELETSDMNIVKEGNFILNITFAWELALAITDNDDDGKLVSHRFPQFKPKRNLLIKFFKHTLSNNKFKHHLQLASPGGAGRNKVLKINEMLKFELLFPNMEEQLAITKILEDFDNLITLHQRKLEHLQLQKKALLQQMFV